MKYLLYDCETTLPHEIFEQYATDNLCVINAAQPAAKCIGCFQCWLKKPGSCKFSDKIEHLGSRLLSSEEIVIVCKSLYGGFSVAIKRILDRAIPGVLPFFEKKNNELHHSKRYNNTPVLKVIFYDSGEMTAAEQAQASKAIAATALNFHASSFSVVFSENLSQAAQEVFA